MGERDQTLTPLLERICVGAAQSVFSPEAWTDRLEGVVFADEYIAQLYAEWLPAEPPNDASREVMDRCHAYIADWHSGWPNLWAHTLRVAGYALHIAAEAAIEPDHAFAVAMLHDVGKFEEMRDGEAHEVIAGRMARKLLSDSYSKLVVSSIAMAVSKQGSSTDPLVRLLHDADKLDKIGASGIVRRVSQVLILPNALTSIDRVANDLGRFPPMKYPFIQPLADSKRAFTTDFIQRVRNTVMIPPV